MIDLYTWPAPNGHEWHMLLEEPGLPCTVIRSVEVPCENQRRGQMTGEECQNMFGRTQFAAR